MLSLPSSSSPLPPFSVRARGTNPQPVVARSVAAGAGGGRFDPPARAVPLPVGDEFASAVLSITKAYRRFAGTVFAYSGVACMIAADWVA